MEQEIFFRDLIKNALELTVVFRSSGALLYLNQTAEEMLEYGSQWSDCTIQDLFPNEFPEKGNVTTQMRYLLGDIRLLTAYRKNRTCFPIKGRFIASEHMDGIYYLVALDETDRDYFERKANMADEEAKEANKVKTEFVATITHELRTPVNGILANTQDLLFRETDEKKRYILRMMERGCRDMSGLINNILDFSKLESGKFILEQREFDFKGMIDYVKTNHQKKITEKGLDFFVTISPEVPDRIVGDELRIVQILNNLISNATKFTDVGKISVEVLKTAQMEKRLELFFLIVDTGIGISKEQQDKLFKSFTQVDASISRRFGGTGLGLNISKQLVELMGGKIRVESEPQKGSVFSFSIWVDLPTDVSVPSTDEILTVSLPGSSEMEKKHLSEEVSPIWIFGTPENENEISQKIDKMILSVELGNYEKAEMFADTLKKLTASAPDEIKSSTLRLKMAVQKADYERIIAAYEEWKKLYDGREK